MTLFGNILTEDQIEEAVSSTIQLWMPTYLAEIERQRDIDVGYYARPREYTTRTEFDSFPEDQLPLIVVIAPRTEDEPTSDGRGVLRTRFTVGVTCIASASDQVSTRKLAYAIGAAVRAILVQHPSLGSPIEVRGLDWTGSQNNELPPEDDRTIWAYRQTFSVEVGDVVSRGRGPTVVPSDPSPPPPELPTADTVDVRTQPIQEQ